MIVKAHKRSNYLKRADQSTQFEEAFANLATAELQDSAPQLLDHILGFQLLEREDDNNRAVGIFGAKIGEQLVYIPAFFTNGEIKGHDMLYLVDTDTLVPRTEPWINYLLNRRPLTMGTGIDKNLAQRGIQSPTYDDFIEYPIKASAVYEPWCKKGLAGFVAAGEPGRYVSIPLQVPNIIKESADVAYNLLTLVDRCPSLAMTLARCYGPGLLKTAFDVAATRGTLMHIRPKSRRKVAKIKEPDLRFYIHGISDTTDLSTAEKLQLMKAGYFIRDKRKEASIAYQVQESLSLNTPYTTGIYEVLTKPTSFDKCVILHKPIVDNSKKSCVLLIRLDDSNKEKAWTYAPSTEVFVTDKQLDVDYRKWLDSLSTVESLEVGAQYVLVGDGGHTGVFEVIRSQPAVDGERCYAVYWPYNYNSTYNSRTRKIAPMAEITDISNGDDCDYAEMSLVVIGRHKTKRFINMGRSVMVPADAKVIKIKQPIEKQVHDVAYPQDVAANEVLPIRPARHVDLHLGIIKRSDALRVITNGDEASINGSKLMSMRDTLFTLVGKHGFREDIAKSIVKQAQRGKCKFRVKYAQPDMGSTVQTLWPEDPTPGPTIFGDKIPGWENYEENVPVPGMEQLTIEPTDITEDPQQLVQQIQQAAQTGQQEVFDAQLLGSLLNTTQENQIIDKYMPSLIKAIDALGRLRINVYWQPDMFSGRFGDRELEELEDRLQSVFNNLGDLAMLLKKRESGPKQHTGIDVNLEAMIS